MNAGLDDARSPPSFLVSRPVVRHPRPVVGSYVGHVFRRIQRRSTSLPRLIGQRLRLRRDHADAARDTRNAQIELAPRVLAADRTREFRLAARPFIRLGRWGRLQIELPAARCVLTEISDSLQW